MNRNHFWLPLLALGVALLLVFGGATLALKDPVFIQWKPTAINWLFALVFFGSHFVGFHWMNSGFLNASVAPPKTTNRASVINGIFSTFLTMIADSTTCTSVTTIAASVAR